MNMAKKVNEVQDGDYKSNLVVLRSVFGKVGQTYFIQPQRDSRGRFADCVKRIDANGDIVLTPEELKQEAAGEAYFVREDAVFEIQDGKTFNLDDVQDRAIWEAIKNCNMIAPERWAKDDKGNYLIDGTMDPNSKRPRYGKAELYVDRPGLEAQRRVTKRKLILDASTYILNDERGYDGRVLVAKVLGRDMKNQPNADVEDFLLSVAETTPEKILNCYTGGDLSVRMLFIEAREKRVITKKDGLYLFGDEGKTVLGATDDAAVAWLKEPRNSKTVALIRKGTFPEMFKD